MTIAFYIPQLYGGGAERVVTNLSNTFSMYGHNVIIITTVRHEKDYSINDGIKRFVLNEMELGKMGLFNKILRFRRLRSICKTEKVNVLIAFLGGAISYSVLAGIGLKTKVVVSERNSPDFSYKTWMSQFFAKLFYLMSNGAVFQTVDAQKWYPLNVQRKSVIIPNPVKEVFYTTTYNPIQRYLVSVGRLTEQKNYELLIRAFSRVIKVYPDVQLHIYGDGHLKSVLQQLIDGLNLTENVVLEGRIDDLSQKLSQAHIFVMSSDVEGMPNALMEAMAMGVPAISTDCPCGGPRMLLSDNRGILVPVKDEMKLADAIIKLLENDELCENLSIEAKSYMNNFRQETIALSWIDFLNGVVNK